MKPILFLYILLLISCRGDTHKAPAPELMYHIVQRSFYDSNGDNHGDLRGIIHKLDYLEALGVTSILILPLYESIYYHNYFPIDFEKIDSDFGTIEDLIELVDALHQRGMKFYMDMEVQYITEDHLWYRDAYGNTDSPYSSFILWDDTLNLEPSSIVYDLTEFEGYDGRSTRLTTLNLNDPGLQAYLKDLFLFFIDPLGDGSFKGGVDGFRIDHMMDDLDNKGRLTGLFKDFWKPLIQDLKAVKPDLTIMAEQADWASTGHEYLEQADVDWVFAFGLCFAIRSFEKEQIVGAAAHTFKDLGKNKNQIVFIANHDIQRFASAVEDNPGKLRAGAALQLLIGGIPSIYYGQEIGMRGTGGWNKYGMTDGNEIPVREAFEWYTDTTGPGMALWYKDTGPWWEDSKLRPFDGISLEEQINDENSLWQFYQRLIRLRNSYPALGFGQYKSIPNDHSHLITFLRESPQQTALIIVNLSNEDIIAEINKNELPYEPHQWVLQFGENFNSKKHDENLRSNISAFGVQVFIAHK